MEKDRGKPRRRDSNPRFPAQIARAESSAARPLRERRLRESNPDCPAVSFKPIRRDVLPLHYDAKTRPAARIRAGKAQCMLPYQMHHTKPKYGDVIFPHLQHRENLTHSRRAHGKINLTRCEHMPTLRDI